MTATAAVQRCETYDSACVEAAIRRQFELLGGLEKFVRKGQRVLIKPNLIGPKPVEVPAQTHPEVIYAVAKIVLDTGATAIVGDSPAWSTTQGCLRVPGVDTRLLDLGAEIVNLENPVRQRIENTNLSISRTALEADVIINVPKLKAHQQLGATFAFKNIFGCVCGMAGKQKAYLHFSRGRNVETFCRMIVGIYHRLKPVVNIIDGIVAMEGQGPLNGTAKQVGYLIAGTDPVVCERVCCEMVGFDPRNLPLLKVAVQVGSAVGFDDPIEIIGDPFERPVCDFIPARLTPLRFTFPHICRSLCKQGILLAKSVAGAGKV